MVEDIVVMFLKAAARHVLENRCPPIEVYYAAGVVCGEIIPS